MGALRDPEETGGRSKDCYHCTDSNDVTSYVDMAVGQLFAGTGVALFLYAISATLA